MTIGERLREARHALNISQRELARRAGISHPIVQALEAGVPRDVGHASLAKLADVLGVSLDWLVRGDVEEDYGIADDDPEYLELLQEGEVEELRGGPAYAAAKRFFRKLLAKHRRERQGGAVATSEPARRLEEEERAG